MNDERDRRDNSEIMRNLGELTGMVRTMNESQTRRLEDIRADIARLEKTSNDRMDRMEGGLNRRIDEVGKRLDGLGTRVTSLESEDKRIIEKVAKLSAMGGGVGGALAAGLVELIKHIKF